MTGIYTSDLMIKEWLERYNPKNKEEAQSALCKIMLEIALAGLYRSVFFDKAAFYGGTALIIFHKLDRFSQDLHFSLLQVEKDFSLKKYQDASVNEFAALRINVSISEKQKVKQNNINSAFPKSETLWRELKLETILPQIGVDSKANIKIKIEVDTAPFEF